MAGSGGTGATERVLITGGAGFIGSHLAVRMAAAGRRVGVLDDLSSGSKEHLEAVAAAGVRPEDVFDAEVSGPEAAAVLARWRPGTVVHLAAQSRVAASVADPVGGARANVTGTVNLLAAAAEAGVATFVAASSGGAAYGTLPEGADLQSEDMPRRPLSPYGASKAAADLYLRMYGESFGVACTSLLLGNVYGPRLDGRYAGDVVSRTIGSLRANRRPTVYGDGMQTRDFVHVSDVVEAFMSACARRAPGAFNIGTGVETSVNRVVELVCEAVGEPVAIHYAPDLPAEVRRVRLDVSAAAERLGWRPAVDLPTGIRDMCAAPRSQPKEPQR